MEFPGSPTTRLRWKKAGRELAEKQKELSAQKDRFIAQLEAHINENIATVTVEPLSNAIGMNSRKLYRFMDSNYGLKPGDMIRNIKQLRVWEILQQAPETDLNELAQSVGYSTPPPPQALTRAGNSRLRLSRFLLSKNSNACP